MLARASWDTAIRPRIFSREGRRRGWAACRARDLTTDEWNVATTGSSVEAHRAMRAAEGFIASGDEVFGEVPHVELHTTGHVPGIGTDHADPHRAPSRGDTRSRSRSSRNTRWSMCQSAVCSRTAAPSVSAHAWVMAVARCRVVPLPGSATQGWNVMTMPHPLPRRSWRIDTGCSGLRSAVARAAGAWGSLARWPQQTTSIP